MDVSESLTTKEGQPPPISADRATPTVAEPADAAAPARWRRWTNALMSPILRPAETAVSYQEVTGDTRFGDIPLSLDTDWGAKLLEVMYLQDRQFDDAFARVMAIYLNAGDHRPLLDLLIHGREPGEIALKYLAGMMVEECRARLPLTGFQYKFCFKQNRGAGRPWSDGHVTAPWIRLIELELCAGILAMADGRRPEQNFWTWLIFALEPSLFRASDKRILFPWRAKIVQIDGREGEGRKEGRRKDPGLPMRDKALAWFVQEYRDGRRSKRREKYDSAIGLTGEDIRKHAAAESWPGVERSLALRYPEAPGCGVCLSTIKNAYDKYKS